jgi:hypothetical protein
VKSLIRLVVAAFVGVSIVGVIGARLARRRIVPSTDPDADEIVLAAIFGPLEYRSTAQSFRGGSIECWYGGGVVDLRAATLDPAGARLTVRAVFGGGQILVPPTWRVVSHVQGIGALSDARPAGGELGDTPSLTIDGIVAFGGFAILSEEVDGSNPRRPDRPRAASGVR